MSELQNIHVNYKKNTALKIGNWTSTPFQMYFRIRKIHQNM